MPHLAEAALYGPAGQAVRTLAPHTEAHPAALLLQLLAAFGNLAGRGPHCMVNTTRHQLNLFVILVGDSSKARKGSSWNQLTHLFNEVDLPWLVTRVTSARLTAADLIDAVRNPQPSSANQTANDRRLLVVSEEFAAVLRGFKRGNSHLSPLLRYAWDQGRLPAFDLHSLQAATEVHLSLIAHITQHELAQALHHAETQNGFANRCLWTAVHRAQCLPDGGNPDPADLSIARELRHALAWASAAPEILLRRSAAANELWRDRYPALSQVGPGLRGAATSRAEAQVLRLSAIYAALDATPEITLPHLQAALAVWDYCYASAASLFGMSTGDPIADRIREAIEATSAGLSQYQIRRLFQGHVETARIEEALEQLVAVGAVSPRTQPTGGRPATLWSAAVEQQQQPEAAPNQFQKDL